MARIFWKPDEIERVAREAVRLRHELQTTTLYEAYSRAQVAVLPAERRRPLTKNMSGFEKVRDRLRALEKTSTVPDEPIVLPGQVVRVEVPVVTSTEDVLAATPTALLVGVLWARLADWVGRSQAAWLSRQDRAPLANGTPLPVPTVPVLRPPTHAGGGSRRLRIGLAGLLRQQFREIQDKLASRPVELVYVNHEQSKPSVPVSLDYLISGKFVSHSWVETVRAQVGERYIQAGTSQNEIVQRVYDLLARQ